MKKQLYKNNALTKPEIFCRPAETNTCTQTPKLAPWLASRLSNILN